MHSLKRPGWGLRRCNKILQKYSKSIKCSGNYESVSLLCKVYCDKVLIAGVIKSYTRAYRLINDVRTEDRLRVYWMASYFVCSSREKTRYLLLKVFFQVWRGLFSLFTMLSIFISRSLHDVVTIGGRYLAFKAQRKQLRSKFFESLPKSDNHIRGFNYKIFLLPQSFKMVLN